MYNNVCGVRVLCVCVCVCVCACVCVRSVFAEVDEPKRVWFITLEQLRERMQPFIDAEEMILAETRAEVCVYVCVLFCVVNCCVLCCVVLFVLCCVVLFCYVVFCCAVL